MDDEVYELLANYRQALELLQNKIDVLEETVRGLEKKASDTDEILFGEILIPAQKAIEEEDRNQRFNEFSDKYGERLDPLAKQVNAIEGGEDFDFVKEAFNNYDNMPVAEGAEKPSSDDFVDTLVEATEEKINAIKEAVGASEVSVTVDESGDTEVVADGEDITDEVTDDEGNLKEPEDIDVSMSEDDEPEVDSPEEVAELEKQLEEEAKKLR